MKSPVFIQKMMEAMSGKVLGEEVVGNTYITKVAVPSQQKFTFIYLKCNGKGHIKIGISKKPKTRQRTLMSQDNTIKLLYSKKFEHKFAVQLEKTLHEIYSLWRLEGEWFALNQNQTKTCIDYIESL